MKRKSALGPEDLRLWRRAIAEARPLPGRTAPNPEESIARTPTPQPELRHPHPPQSLHSGIEGTLRKRLRRGRIKIEARLDLHGLRQKEAHAALNRFLSAAEARGLRLLLVITGKGRGLDSTLKRLVPLWLAEGSNRTRVAFVSEAAPHDGGAGALYVYLARRAAS
jgi:DNA-nicking Smr family endonuclease